MELKHLCVLLTLLIGLLALYMYGHMTRSIHHEGFQVPRCPPNFRFFNDTAGASFCCRGSVNPYTHTCESPLVNDLCAFTNGTPDPRDPRRTLQHCSKVLKDVFETGQKKECPAELPHYSTDGINARCCKTATSVDGSTCIAADLAEESEEGRKTGYCIAKGDVRTNEKRCSELKMIEDVRCPSGFQTVRYVLADRESERYGKQVTSVAIPACYRVNESCIPDAALDFVSKEYGAFADRAKTTEDGEQDWSTWKWSCSGLDKLNRGLGDEVTSHLYP